MSAPNLGVPSLAVPTALFQRGSSVEWIVGTTQFATGGNTVSVPWPGANDLFAWPFFTGGRPARVAEIAFFVTAAAAAGGRMRVGLYKSDPNTLRPTVLLGESGELATDAVGIKTHVFTDPRPLDKDSLYWFALNHNVVGTQAQVRCSSSYWPIFGYNAAFGTPQTCWRRQGHVYGAMPNPFPSDAIVHDGLAVNACIMCGVRVLIP